MKPKKTKAPQEVEVPGWSVVRVTENFWTPCGGCGGKPRLLYFRKIKMAALTGIEKHEFRCVACAKKQEKKP